MLADHGFLKKGKDSKTCEKSKQGRGKTTKKSANKIIQEFPLDRRSKISKLTYIYEGFRIQNNPTKLRRENKKKIINRTRKRYK